MNKERPTGKLRREAGFAPQENVISILPSILAGIILLLLLIFSVLILYPDKDPARARVLIIFGISGCAYFGFLYFLLDRILNQAIYAWANALILSLGLCLLSRFIPANLDDFLFALIIVVSILSAIISDRAPAYFLSISFLFWQPMIDLKSLQPFDWIIRSTFVFTALMSVETIQQLKNIARKQVKRLELINELSKQITSTLETAQVIHLLNATFQNTIEADTYYLGIVEGEDLDLQLFYDDGEYFNGTRTRLHGTLSGWVINNQKELFLPDLRKKSGLENVEAMVIGRNKLSLSWMGVPIRGSHVSGIMVVASYRPNGFDKSDLELLNTIAQRAAHALDNAYHHAHVEEQSRLDSLTGVLNHSFFLKTLDTHAQDSIALNTPLSLIMLDIDFFKQYNDKYGHQTGDEILVSLCRIIRDHIKKTDCIGRWGGEEFCILLVNANVEQARQIAQRIRETLANLRFNNERVLEIPAPTISQGIAMFPQETKDINKLIDLADQRLFIAKERGRDQIEMPPEI